MRHGGHVLIESLVALGATKAFGVPGESYLAALDAMYETQGRLDFVNCRNEGGAGFMAAAWGQLHGQPGIAFVTRGPGATNASIGVHSAMQDSTPMILFIGQVGTDAKEREAFQEIDYRAMFGPIAKWATEIEDPARISEIVSRAWTVALSGRPGPVVVALPEDMLSAPAACEPLTGPIEMLPPAPHAEAAARTREILQGAERPVILYGGAAWNGKGAEAFQAFAEASGIPVVSVFRNQDMFDNDSPVFCGESGVGTVPSVQKLIREADVILALGTRFGENATGGYELIKVPQPTQRIVHVHADASEIGKVCRPVLGVHADPGLFCMALNEGGPVSGGWSDWCAEGRGAFEAMFDLPDLPSPVDMGKVMAHLREILPADTILTNGAGNFSVWPGRFFRYGRDNRMLSTQAGAMGYGVPAAIAAKIAHPSRRVICIAGDGDFQMNGQELATAAQEGACPIVLIVNNGTYGTIRAHQERHYPERVSGTNISNPDFAMLARAYGFHGERVETTADFEAAFARALESDTGAVLDLNVSAEALTPRMSLSEMRAAALKKRETA